MAARWATVSHVIATTAIPSTRRSRSASPAPGPPARRITAPMATVTANATAKPVASVHSRYHADRAAGTRRAGPKRPMSVPVTWAMTARRMRRLRAHVREVVAHPIGFGIGSEHDQAVAGLDA